MKHRYFFFLFALALLVPSADCLAISDMVVNRLAEALDPILNRVKAEMNVQHTNTWIELWHRELDKTPENKVIGPTVGGLVFHAKTITDVANYKPSERPFDWEGFPTKERYPWSSEFHYFPVSPGRWLVISIWCGPSANQELVRELLAAASKSAEKERKIFWPR